MNKQVMQASDSEPFFPMSNVQTVTLGMGCFWSPEALFGHLPGVIRTRTGYAGGTSMNPAYRQMGDHTETVQLDFSPSIITFDEILEVFWNNHNPVNINNYKGRQYLSLLFYSDDKQRETIQHVLRRRKEQGRGEPETEIAPYSGFHLAEDKHQKYYLKRFPNAIEKLNEWFPSQDDLNNSTLAARLNGLAKGYTNLERILNEMGQWPIRSEHQKLIVDLVKQIRW